jgi:hypothetical protein
MVLVFYISGSLGRALEGRQVGALLTPAAPKTNHGYAQAQGSSGIHELKGVQYSAAVEAL